MKIFIISMSLILSNMFFMVNHPIALVILILLQTSILCTSIFLITFSSWFSLIMFLIFMGGLMVLFIYIASLASNEMFSIKFNFIYFILFTTLLFIFMNLNTFNNQNLFNESMNFKMYIFPIFSNYLANPTILLMLYLLLTLLITVNIVKLYEAPIRSMI